MKNKRKVITRSRSNFPRVPFSELEAHQPLVWMGSGEATPGPARTWTLPKLTFTPSPRVGARLPGALTSDRRTHGRAVASWWCPHWEPLRTQFLRRVLHPHHGLRGPQSLSPFCWGRRKLRFTEPKELGLCHPASEGQSWNLNYNPSDSKDLAIGRAGTLPVLPNIPGWLVYLPLSQIFTEHLLCTWLDSCSQSRHGGNMRQQHTTAARDTARQSQGGAGVPWSGPRTIPRAVGRIHHHFYLGLCSVS